MLRDFRGHTAVISGAGSGIGRSLALGLARAGVGVAALDIDADQARAVAGAARDMGVPALGLGCDVALRTEVEAAHERILKALGQPRLVWANAGVGAMGGPLGMAQADLDWIWSVNVTGVLNVVRTCAAPMRALTGARHVGLTASVSGLTAMGAYAAGYGATKHAVIGIGEGLRAELEGSGMGVTILCPGLVATRIWDGARVRPARHGGPVEMPHAVGDRWRIHGMDPDWVAALALARVDAGGGYVAPVDPHSRDDFARRAAEIDAAFHFPVTA
jgi:NAD(P)-dependent dehydrogenase (short-subunit alcohol dehydrogenase family)